MRLALATFIAAVCAATAFAPAAMAESDPVANFSYDPPAPFSHETITFTSTSTADRPIAREEWDLDGDGAYDDAVGSTVTWAFDIPGIQTVRLRTIDNIGGYGVVTR